MKLSLGPVPYLWPRERVEAFYREVEFWPVDIVYLGETVCSKRRALGPREWMALGERLARSGKTVVLSTLTLIEAESELATLDRLCTQRQFAVEANDIAAVRRLAGRVPFVAGPQLNIYNHASLAALAEAGAQRWVPPVELSQSIVSALHAARPAGVATEVLAFGRLPLAASARCFTARAYDVPKDECRFLCGEHPDGMALRTQEGDALFTVNGVMLQSGRPVNLLEDVTALMGMGVEVLRVSPLADATEQAVRAFRRVIDGDGDAAREKDRLDEIRPGGWCNGYWHGRAGMEWAAW